MDDNFTDSLDEIVRYVNSPGPKKLYSGRRYSKLTTTGAIGIDKWTVITKQPRGYKTNSKFAGCFIIVIASIIISMMVFSFIPGIASADTIPTGPQPPQPPPPPNNLPPPIQELPSLPFEKPAFTFQQDFSQGRIIQPHLSLTHNIQPIVGSIAIPNILVVLIGLTVIEKIKVKKRMTAMKVTSGG